MSDIPVSSAKTAFAESASDMSALMAKYGIKTLKGLGTVAVVAGPLVVAVQIKSGWEEAAKGRPIEGVADVIPLAPELIEMGLAGAAFKQALKEGAWKAAGQAGFTRLAAGTAGGLAGGLFLTLAVDLGQSALHDRGFKVDNGMIATMANRGINANNAAVALFPGDTPPILQDRFQVANSITKHQTGPYQWDLIEEYEDTFQDGFTTSESAPIVIHSKLDQRGIGTFQNETLLHFKTFYGNYESKDLNELAKAMYDDPDQADTVFKDYIYAATVRQGFRLAKEQGTKLNGTDQPLGPTDLIPPGIMKQAAQDVMEYMKHEYVVGSTAYLEKGLAYLNPKYAKPENIQTSRLAAAQFIELYGKNGFDWSNPDQSRLMRAAVDQALKDAPKVRPEVSRTHKIGGLLVSTYPNISSKALHVSGPSHNEEVRTRMNAEQRHATNQNIIGKIVEPDYLQDPQTKFFDHKKMGRLQEQLMQAGYLAPAYCTGNINGQTMRAIDAAVKSELSPKDINQEQGDLLFGKATTLYKSLIETPADPSSFDPRVLSFQTSAYLLGLYEGRLDGLGGPQTMAAQEKLGGLLQGATAEQTATPAAAVKAMEPAPPAGP